MLSMFGCPKLFENFGRHARVRFNAKDFEAAEKTRETDRLSPVAN